MLCLVVITVLGVDMEMFGAEAVALCERQGQQLKGIWATNGGVGAWSRGCMGVVALSPVKKSRERKSPLQHRDRDSHGQE